jgi:hypothetical protein
MKYDTRKLALVSSYVTCTSLLLLLLFSVFYQQTLVVSATIEIVPLEKRKTPEI